MRSINATEIPLHVAFDVGRGVTAFVGGGGKTTCMLRLAGALSRLGSVLVTTSTHIYPPAEMPILDSPSVSETRAALTRSNPVCVGAMEPDGKLAAPGIPMQTFAALADYVLVEADGAKGLPLKAPASHEPAIPPCASAVIAVAGLDGIGLPVKDAAFRSELYADVLGTELTHSVAPEDVARVLCHPRGQYKNVRSQMRFMVLLNKADTPERVALARRTAERLDASRVERVVIASVKEMRAC